ncbi:MAG: hydantoinase/oxoprolinase family protein [Alphaproteobacteria bacterium]|nr:hydantoinase/oxoprolinase family protein [Alphaproteobacteria bacterium]MBL6777381.1 hydantoinase/oxoprolinase family protein [Alphaproteobacteria bacterium]
MSRKMVIGVDVGGTFTDILALDEISGTVKVVKTPSTRGDQSIGFLEGILSVTEDLSAVATVIHGTTVATNALLERKGAKTGIITTAGFRDVLEMRRRDRPQTWGLWGQFVPVVDRQNRIEVAERTLADGTIRQAVNEQEVKAAAETLLANGCLSVCLFFINGYANPKNEQVAAKILRACWLNEHVSVATEILPEIREFERCSTATLNAYLQPPVANYLARLEDRIAEQKAESEILIVQSNGGVMSVESAKSLPIKTALSGPAAGVVAARQIASAAGFDNIITGDMGGTSFDVSLVADGQNMLTAQVNIDFGMTIRVPMIEMTTIGAGGGSIAHIDETGLLEIGPESAGSDPGPACYGLGNTRPTVTDANLLLGRIDATNPIGGKQKSLDKQAAIGAIETNIAKPLGLDVYDAAEAIIKVANAKMGGAIRLISIERGYDPKLFAMMPFGGGGALHTGALMLDIGLGASVVPRYPGVNSALGCVMSDLRHDEVRTMNVLLDGLDCAELAQMIKEITLASTKRVQNTKAKLASIDRIIELDMLYMGQSHSVAVPILEDPEKLTVATIGAAFDRAYTKAYSRPLTGIPIRILNLRLSMVGVRPAIDLQILTKGARANSVASCLISEQPIYADGSWHNGQIIDRLRLPEGAELHGPALLVQPDATIYLDPFISATVDSFGNIIMKTRG